MYRFDRLERACFSMILAALFAVALSYGRAAAQDGSGDDCVEDPLCDDDPDGDGIPSSIDNCPDMPNPEQRDYDADARGDLCDADADGDRVPEIADPQNVDRPVDNCPFRYNPRALRLDRDDQPIVDQADADGDGLGDVCDDDDDGDGVLDCGPDGLCDPQSNGVDDDRDLQVDEAGECDMRHGDAHPCRWGNRDGFDNDADGFIDEWGEAFLWRDGDPALPQIDYPGPDEGEDNCRLTPNPDQADRNGNGIGDACDPDVDNDGVGLGDNCPRVPNPDQADLDGDRRGDSCDEDADGDQVLDIFDNCPLEPNPHQVDQDGDGLGDACDEDADGDGEIDFRGCQAQPGRRGGWPAALIVALLALLGLDRRRRAQGAAASGQ